MKVLHGQRCPSAELIASNKGELVKTKQKRGCLFERGVFLLIVLKTVANIE